MCDSFVLTSGDYISISIVIFIIGLMIYFKIKDYMWKRKRVDCQHCNRSIWIAHTMTNILSDRVNWQCYYCKEFNYKDEE